MDLANNIRSEWRKSSAEGETPNWPKPDAGSATPTQAYLRTGEREPDRAKSGTSIKSSG